ncbi:MAG TPA: hypothetical protein VL442_23525 [Mucilaginibacter sp.]|jgi:hypothetical protein|nr:hypothetical protein [Mucilaginibacter sp.]
MLEESEKPRYTIPHRLSDVIALISVLAQFKHAFMSEQMLIDALRGSPRSKKSTESADGLTWAELVENHQEFFRRNGNSRFYALVIRSYFDQFQDPEFPKDPKAKIRRQLTVEETQNLINVAVNLHEKELQRLQKNAYLVPIGTAAVTLIGIIFTSFISYTALNDKIIPKIDTLNNQIKILKVNKDTGIINQTNGPIPFLPFVPKYIIQKDN